MRRFTPTAAVLALLFAAALLAYQTAAAQAAAPNTPRLPTPTATPSGGSRCNEFCLPEPPGTNTGTSTNPGINPGNAGGGGGCTQLCASTTPVGLNGCLSNCPPAIPQNLYITDKTSHSMSLQWFAESSAQNDNGYYVERRLPGGAWSAIDSLLPAPNPVLGVPTKMTYQDNGYGVTPSGLNGGTEYCYRVEAWNNNGMTPSNQACATTFPNPLVSPRS